MHMADALISPIVGGAMWGTSAGILGYSANKLKMDLDQSKVPLMGVMGAFVFAAQMMNISIPLTGSSGHIGGGLLLAILLGPYAGFLTMASILLIQALIFADGGLLALGCNMINLGFFTCFIAYPLIYTPIIRNGLTKKRLIPATILAAVVGLQLGSIGVVLETVVSGRTQLSLMQFLLIMQPIHLIIGLIEGVITATVIVYIHQERPEMLSRQVVRQGQQSQSMKKVMVFLLLAAMIISGLLSVYASQLPDGLEWALSKVTVAQSDEKPSGIHKTMGDIQENTALMPEYQMKDSPSSNGDKTSLSGLIGGLVTMIFICLFAGGLKLYQMKKNTV